MMNLCLYTFYLQFGRDSYKFASTPFFVALCVLDYAIITEPPTPICTFAQQYAEEKHSLKSLSIHSPHSLREVVCLLKLGGFPSLS